MSESWKVLTDVIETPFLTVKFQSGPIKEHGVNGCHIEDVLRIALNRLNEHQKTEFACRENALAITKIEESLHWLNHRTAERIRQGVEGRDVKHV